jgi:hypothetical protein
MPVFLAQMVGRFLGYRSRIKILFKPKLILIIIIFIIIIDIMTSVMSTRLTKRDIYELHELTGLSRKCDWFINGTQLINITNTQDPKFIFLTAYKGGVGINYLVKDLLPTILSKFILIIASEDYTFPYGTGDVRHNEYKGSQEFINILLESTKLIHIFVENLDTIHTKLSPIPLGLLDSSFMIDIESPEINPINFSKKEILCLCSHRTRHGLGQFYDRSKADTLSTNNWNNFVTFKLGVIPRHDYIKTLIKTKFCLCIHGGGYDPCPRFFECILYGVIPIIQHSPLDEVFMKFPVVFIDSLTENSLSELFLLEKFEELRGFYEDKVKRKKVLTMLTLDYWWNIINNKFNTYINNPLEIV